MASLLILTGPRKGSRLTLTSDRTFLGRETGCDIVIDENMLGQTTSRTASVSRRHALISCLEGNYFIEDGDGQGNRSRNGIVVNDKKVPFPGNVRLRNNDCIRICDFSCTFQDNAEPGFAVQVTLDHESSVQSLLTQPMEKLRVILEISSSLSTTLDVEALLPQIVENLFRLFKQADRAFIILRDEATGGLVVHASKTRESGKEPDNRFSASIVWRCLETVQAILGNDLAEQFPESESACALPTRSLMCAPLWSQEGQALGAIQLDTSAGKMRFTQEDLNLLLGVASQASIALCNARLHRDSLAHQVRQQELNTARQVLWALLPNDLPEVPGYEFYAYYEPAQEIGGDYYDFIPLPGRRLAILLGDVAGKSVAAALVMVKFSVETRVCLEREPDLATAVSKLNALMHRAALADRFVTLAAAVLDPATHTVTLVNAGHPSPLLTRRATSAVEEAGAAGLAGKPIGVEAGYPYRSCEVQLLPGDGLVLFSDGITDAMDAQGQRFKTRSVHAVPASGATSPRATGERLIQAVKRHAAGCSQNDDITLVCFGRSPSKAKATVRSE
jgi:phosphoserine phosphatase RsbU/P